MKRLLTRLVEGIKWLARSLAAVIALILIVAALVVGYDVGRRAASPAPQAAEASAPAHEHEVGADAESPPGRVQMYTCSMHPTVRLPDPNAKCPICHMDLIPVPMDEDEGLGPRQIRMSEEALRLAEVQTAAVARYFPIGETRLVGKVAYDETRLATIAAYFPARIERLYIGYAGVAVEKGEHLAEIYSPDLIAAQAELRRARAAVDASRAATDAIRRSAETTLDAARGRLRLWGLNAEQIAQFETSERLIERLTLHAPISGIVTGRLVVEGRYVETGEELFELADLSRVWVMLDAYESQLPFIHYGQDVEFTSDAFPGESFHGRISFIEPMLTMMSRTVRVRLAVENADLRLKPGMYVRAVVRGRVGTQGVLPVTDLAGKWISPMHPEIVKDGPGTCDVCGMDLVPFEQSPWYVEPRGERAPLVIPDTAPLITGTRAVVYVRVPDAERPTFEGRDVVLGPRAGRYYIVRDGLREGEEIVVHGAFRIDSSLQIAGKPSMMNPKGGSGAGAHQHGAAPAGAGGASIESAALPEHFRRGLDRLLLAYIELQEALGGDDFAAFLDAAPRAHDALASVDETGLIGEPLGQWRRIRRTLGEAPADLRDAPDIGAARARFEHWSDALIDAVGLFGHSSGEVILRMHCPMAFDDKGADWLQHGEDLVNPYFGAEMLRCGEFVAEYLSDSPPAHEHGSEPQP